METSYEIGATTIVLTEIVEREATIIARTSAILPRNSSPVVQSPTKTPIYASACSGTGRYSSACSCIGAPNGTTTPPTPTVVKTVIQPRNVLATSTSQYLAQTTTTPLH